MDNNQRDLEIASLESQLSMQPEAAQADPAALSNLHNLNSTEGVDASDEN